MIEVDSSAKKQLVIEIPLLLAFIGVVIWFIGVPYTIGLITSVLSGIIIAASSSLYLKKFEFDSLLRYGVINSENSSPELMRKNYCAISHDKLPFLSFHGSHMKLSEVKLSYYLAITAILLYGFGVLVIIALIPSVKMIGSVWTISLVIANSLIYFVLRKSVNQKVYKTAFSKYADSSGQTPWLVISRDRQKMKSIQEENKDRQGWLLITAERDEEGLPTRNIKIEEREKPLGYWRNLLLIPK